MAIITVPQTNFVSGKFTKRLYGRFDLQQYLNAVKTITNFKVFPHGPAQRRSGTRYIAEVKNSAHNVRLIPFTHSTEISYVLEFGDQYFRVYKNEGQVKTVTGADLITNGAFPTDLSGWTDKSVGTGSIMWNVGAYADIISVDSANFGWLEQLVAVIDLKRYLITFDVLGGSVDVRAGITPGGQELQNDITFAVGTGHQMFFTACGISAYIGFRHETGATHSIDNVVVKEVIPVEIATTFLHTELTDIEYDQSANVLYIVHPTRGKLKIERTSDSVWAISSWGETDGPYLKENVTAITLAPAATSGTNVTVVASAALFAATDVGRMIRMKHVGSWGTGRIITFTDSTHVQVNIDVINDRYGPGISTIYGGTTAVPAWRLSAWSSALGFPRTIHIANGRMLLGGSLTAPNDTWQSESDDFESFRPTARDSTVSASHAIARTLDSGQVNSIKWITSLKNIFFGTSNNIFKISAGESSSLITPGSIEVDRVSGSSSKAVKPIVTDTSILFVTRSGRKIKELIFQFTEDSHKTPDMTLLAEDITLSGVADMTLAEEPDNIVYAIMQNGKAAGMTFKRDQNIVAWFDIVLGGADVSVKSHTTVPSANQVEDTLYVAVSRTINGATKIYIEFHEENYAPTSATDTDKAYFVDCGISYKGKKTTVISGLKHLEGETVQILGDGAVLPDQVVDSTGAITISVASAEVHVGLGYDSELGTLDIKNVEVSDGTTKGRVKKVAKAIVNFVDSIGGKIGANNSNLDTIPTRSDTIPMDSGPPLFDGFKVVSPRGSEWDRETGLTIIQDQPLPMTVTGIIYEVEI